MPRIAKQTAEPTEGSYLRSKRPVRVRRSFLGARRTWVWSGLLAAGMISAGLGLVYGMSRYLRTDPLFVYDQWFERDELRIDGLSRLDEEQIRVVFAPDRGKSLLDVPLRRRREDLLALPWVEQAVLARVWPNQLSVRIRERRPIAFVRLPKGGKRKSEQLRVIDAHGVLLDPPEGEALSLPVLTGVSPSMPLAERRKRTALLQGLIRDLDREQPYYSEQVSEVDLTDLVNVKVTTVHNGEPIELNMGDRLFRHRFEIFLEYIDSWKREYQSVRSVDLRFKGHVAIQ